MENTSSAIDRKTWLTFTLFALICFTIWFNFSYPKISFIDLSITKVDALNIAQNYLKKSGVNPDEYRHAIIFSTDRTADHYLQYALGFKKELAFLKEHNFELFFWNIRFFKENEVEGYRVSVSAATGEVTDYHHGIKPSAERPDYGEEAAKQVALDFLEKKFDYHLTQDYILHSDFSKKLDNRTDYSFNWEKKAVSIRWSDKEEDTGGAKLLTGAAVSGNEILSFSKNALKIPNEFDRYMSEIRNVGHSLAILFRYIYITLLTASIFYVVVSRNNLVLHSTKNWAIILTAFLFLLHILNYLNAYQAILFSYPTTISMSSYLWQYITANLMDTFIVTISILMPLLSAESLHYEMFKSKREGAFLHYLLSTFRSRKVFQLILLGYLGAVIMIGIQSFAFEIGERYLGVWTEITWMAQLSEAHFPFLAAFILGFSASFTEEIAFRVFSISLGKKFLKNTFLAVILASLIWGFGHSTYPVFPMWFRGLEVTCLGIFLSYVYLRFGLIPVLVTHYLFDVFWSSSAFLLGNAAPYHFYSAIAVLLIPMLIGIIAYIFNKPDTERPMRWRLTKHQIFNLEVLKHYLKNTDLLSTKPKEELKKEISAHGWDIAVVEMALDDLHGPSADSPPNPKAES